MAYAEQQERGVKQVLALSMLVLLLLAAWAGINPALAAAALRSVRDARRWVSVPHLVRYRVQPIAEPGTSAQPLGQELLPMP